MNKKYIVKLNEAQRKQIFEVIDNEKTSSKVRRRCNVLLLLDESTRKPMTHEEIATRYETTTVTVGTTAKDFCTGGLGYALRARVHKKPPNAPIVNGEAEARIIALACGQPPDGYSRWTIHLLTKRIVELEIVERIGRETVRRTLKKLNFNLIE